MTFPRTLALGFLALSLVAVPAATAASPWLTDLDAALAAAAAAKKPVLVDFSGSDWCGWCQKLDEEVFTKPAFLEWAAKSVVLCVLDFPRDKTKVPAEQAVKNRAAMEKYQVEGYPTVLLLSEAGAVLVRSGYAEGGPEAYVKALEAQLQFGRDYPQKRAALDSLTGAAKTSAAVGLLEDMPDGEAEKRLDVARVLYAADPENLSGKRPLAAFVLVMSAEEAGTPAADVEAWLKSADAKDPDQYYRKFLALRAQSGLRALLHAAGRAEPSSAAAGQPPVRAAAADLVARATAALALLDDAESRQMLFLSRAVANGCTGVTSAAEADFAAAAAAGAEEDKVGSFRGLLEKLSTVGGDAE